MSTTPKTPLRRRPYRVYVDGPTGRFPYNIWAVSAESARRTVIRRLRDTDEPYHSIASVIVQGGDDAA